MLEAGNARSSPDDLSAGGDHLHRHRGRPRPRRARRSARRPVLLDVFPGDLLDPLRPLHRLDRGGDLRRSDRAGRPAAHAPSPGSHRGAAATAVCASAASGPSPPSGPSRRISRPAAHPVVRDDRGPSAGESCARSRPSRRPRHRADRRHRCHDEGAPSPVAPKPPMPPRKRIDASVTSARSRPHLDLRSACASLWSVTSASGPGASSSGVRLARRPPSRSRRAPPVAR